MSLPFYVVGVGNIGTVCEDSDRSVAQGYYDEYVALSESGRGRAAGEPVTMFHGDTIVMEHVGTVDE